MAKLLYNLYVQNKEKKYYVYVDYTNEDRPYYVGKGNEKRTRILTRNELHESIARRHGLIRKIVFETTIEEEAFKEECRLIEELHTHAREGGANFTMGGEGFSGLIFTEEHKQNLSQALKEFYKDPVVLKKHGWHSAHRSAETKEKWASKMRGKKQTEEHQQKKRVAMKRHHELHPFSPERKSEISKRMKETWDNMTPEERIARSNKISEKVCEARERRKLLEIDEQ